MEDRSWEQRLNALTHILTNPTTTPPLHSQLFVATQVPCYLNWDYPPLLCHHKYSTLKWSIAQFFKKVLTFGFPQTSWRSKCPYQVPPALVLAKGVEEAKWDEEEKRKYGRMRLSRKRIGSGSDVNPFIPFLVPNVLLLSLLLWDPIPIDEI